jgi:hypothetical protein
MKARIPRSSWERLSAYLDGQLDDRAAQIVKRDLDARPDLKKAYEDLQRYKAILKEVPLRKAQRNFTLKPGMLKVPTLPRLVPVFRYASAVVAFLALILFAIDLLPSMGAPKEAAPAADSFVASAAPQIINWGGQESSANLYATLPVSGLSDGYGGGVGGGAPETAGALPIGTPLNPPSFTPSTASAEAITAPLVASPSEVGATPEPTPMLKAETSATDRTMDQALTSNALSPILGIPPTEEQGKVVPATSTPLREIAAISQPSRILTFIAGGLLILAAASGITSWVLVKRKA